MKYLCTLSDYNYLPLGLSLYESLLETITDDFILYYLALDIKTEDKIKEIPSSKIKVINLDWLISQNPDLQRYQQREYREFVWMLASYFTDYLMKSQNPEHITYIDSDIYFYEDIDIIYKEIDTKSVGIIRHRHISEDSASSDGKYNVGVVYFKNDKVGKYCLDWWKDAVINRRYPHLATCYDQKYLEGFLQLFTKNEICVADSFGHGAPWQYSLYDWSTFVDDGHINWQGKKQKIVFNHFSRIQFDVNNNFYKPSGSAYGDYTNNFELYKIESLKKIYDNYFEVIKKITNKYKL